MLAEFLKRIKLRRKIPEESIPLRIFTFLTVMTGVTAVLCQQDWPIISIPIILCNVIGFYVSYIRRHHKNTILKIILAFLMLYVLYDFLRNLAIENFAPQIPLSNLLLWLQTLHSYDLPTRRDLNYSLLVGLILMGVASVLAIDSRISLFYIPFVFFSLTALIYNNLSKFNFDSEEKKDLKFQFVFKHVSFAAIMLIPLSIIIMLFIPRFEGFGLSSVQYSWIISLPNITFGKLINPGMNENARNLRKISSRRLLWNPEAYFGFNSYVHLNYRGYLSNQEVMRVQSNRWTYLRGLAFDFYDGTGWEITGEEEGDFKTISKPYQPLVSQHDIDILKNWEDSVRIVQIYHIRREMPNIVFGAYNIGLIYFPSDTIYEDKNGGLRSPYPLEKGMVYSTISRYLPMTPEDIRRIEKNHQLGIQGTRFYFEKYPSDYEKYTQLPPDLPKRIKHLTKQIISDSVGENASDLRKAQAVARYLRETYTYDLNIPHFPDKSDTVDYFLFEQKRGYCEHFASALAVMLRTQGIPTRMIFGYVPGEYNPYSRFYTVRQNDAHAWVDAYIPGFGWYEFDPTPGFNEQAYSEIRNRNRWLFMSLIERIFGKMPDLSIKPEIFAVVTVLVLFLVIIFFTIMQYKKEVREKKTKRNKFFDWLFDQASKTLSKIEHFYSLHYSKKEEHPAILMYRNMIREFEARGITRSDSYTAREFLGKSVPQTLFADASFIVSAFELARYSLKPPGDEEILNLQNIWESLREKIRKFKFEGI